MSIELPYHEVTQVGDYQTLAQAIPWQIGQNGIHTLWKTTRGAGVTVMCIDTGFSNHPDNCNEVKGPSFVASEPDALDYNGHGSHVAGIIGACDNSTGVVGVAPRAKVISVKAMDKNGRARTEAIERALRYALDTKPDVINASFGSQAPMSETIQHLVNKIWEANIPLVCAAGNQGPGSGLMYPAQYNNVFAVGAVDIHKMIAPFSAQGEAIDFAAPGVEIISTFLNKQYAVMSGTSQAAPFVTGLIALIVAYNRHKGIRHMSNESLFNILKASSIDLGPKGYDNAYGNGIIDPAKMFETQGKPGVPTPEKKSFFQKIFFWIK